ncbi:hypothetical protein E2P63_00100 [Candidatus Bathyarchaeota archaeon]|nr:hypothetical protein E2P63_00100 [Candidatus Bathyarchaeota archaeon]
MDQKTIAIVVIAVVVVAVIGVAAYYMWGTGPTEPEPTPTPTPTGVEGASSLEFTVEITGGASAGTYNYKAKNLGTEDIMIRIDIPMEGMELGYIVNGAQQKAWANEGSGWVLSASFSEQLDLWKATWDGYTGELATWTSGDWTYTGTEGETIKITSITVNPTLADSLFEVA